MSDLRHIELLVLDVDGILTDGSIYVSEDGAVAKRFAIVDGAGIKLLLRAGVGAAIISGHAHQGVIHRFRALGVDDVMVGIQDKGAALRRILEEKKLRPEQIAVMGDDLMDLPMMRGAGFAATVPEAHPRVLERADYVTTRPGGRGAVREVIEKILRAQNRFDAALEDDAG
jgi:3-deoxy-D-manno-octulosonate 8-phosphate phosphatase (KDO 8-P phosphatase)